jgi:DNA-binding NtrC family response regulator
MADLLVVDDDRDLGELMVSLLESQGHRVRVGRNGREGLALVAERHPELVLLDVDMPFLTGPEMTYRMFLRDLGQETIPIVLLSAVRNLSEVARVVGTPYFLGKPYDFSSLSRLVARALVERQAPAPARAVRDRR